MSKQIKCFLTTSICLFTVGQPIAFIDSASCLFSPKFFFTIVNMSEIVEFEGCLYTQRSNKEYSILSLEHFPQL